MESRKAFGFIYVTERKRSACVSNFIRVKAYKTSFFFCFGTTKETRNDMFN